jgi:gliding motility-associated-like protein
MEQTLRLYETPVAEFEIDSLEGCQDLRAHFQNYSTGDQFFWDFGDGNTSTEVSPEHIYFDAGEYDVQLVSAFDDVCFDTLHLESLVSVWPKPNADFRWEENLINNTSTGDLQFINLSEDASTYLWDFGTNNFSTEENPSYRFERNGIWEVQLMATSSQGCVDDTLMIIPHDLIKGLHIPNAFSPLDGIGETTIFMPKGIGLKEYQIQIFSPYGQLLWESTKLQDGEPLEGWDGKLNGELLPQDVYVWKVNAIFDDQTNWRGQKIKGGRYKRMGSVTLLR